MKIDKTTIERALEWAAMGVRLGGIANVLKAEGLPLPAGADQWDSAAVKRILSEAGVTITEARMGAGEGVDDDDDLSWPESHCGIEPDLP